MSATLEKAHRISEAAWDYRGFTIRTRKKLNMPLYYAWVYKKTGDYGFPVDRDDEPAETREQILKLACWEIDDYYKDKDDIQQGIVPPHDFGIGPL